MRIVHKVEKTMVCILILAAAAFLLTGCRIQPKQGKQAYLDYFKEEFRRKNRALGNAFLDSVNITVLSIDPVKRVGDIEIEIPDLRALYVKHRPEIVGDNKKLERILTESISRDKDQVILIQLSDVPVEKYDGQYWIKNVTKVVNPLIKQALDEWKEALYLDFPELAPAAPAPQKTVVPKKDSAPAAA